jgi:mannose-1-phosphate guanylyltransferase
LECAFDIAAQHPSSVVLLGASPQSPEVDYGWIELGPSFGGADDVRFHVRRFREKPSFQEARQLIGRGSLWNTFVMVGDVRGFMEMVNVTHADVVDQLRRNLLWAGLEVHIQDSLYDRIHSVDFRGRFCRSRQRD